MGKSEQISWTGVGANQILIFPIYESMDEWISSRPLAFFVKTMKCPDRVLGCEKTNAD